MANGSSRVLALIVFLVIGLVAGWLLHKPETKGYPAAPTAAQDWKITVGPDPCDLHDPAGTPTPIQRIQRDKHHIEWEAADKKAFLYIIAHVDKACAIPPSSKWTSIGKDSDGNDLYLIGDGKDWKVDSGKLDPKACPSTSDRKTWIKYDQYLQLPSGPPVFRSCDGMIIIDP